MTIYNNKSLLIIFLINFTLINCLISQNQLEMDSFNVNVLESNSIILYNSLDKLIEYKGHPNSFAIGIKKFCFEKMDKFYELDILFYYNPRISYYVYNDSVQIESIHFDKKNHINIYHPKINFNRNLKMEDFIKIFNIPDDRIYKLNYGFMPFKIPRGVRYYEIDFMNAGECKGLTSFYFDNKGFLEAIYFSYGVFLNNF